MISTSKQHKSKGQQAVTSVEFIDYVNVTVKDKQFKVCVDDAGISLLSQDQHQEWLDISPLGTNSQLWAKMQESVTTNTQEIAEHKNKLIVLHNECKKQDELIQQLQCKNSNMLQIISGLQLQLKVLQTQFTDLSNLHQQRQQQQPQQQQQQTLQLSETIEPQVQQTVDMEYQSETTVSELEKNFQQTKDESSIETNIHAELSASQQNNNQPMTITKTFQIKQTSAEQIILYTKESIDWPRTPKILNCRHIRQFFDVQVQSIQDDGGLVIQMDPKLKNKQTIFVIQAM